MNAAHDNGTDAAARGLPELADERVDAIEETLFAHIAADRVAGRARGVRRRRIWVGVGAAAAIVVVAAVLAPAIGRVVMPAGSAQSVELPVMGAADTSGGIAENASGVALSDLTRDASREVIATGSATLVVDDVAEAAARIGEAAVTAGGYVESATIGQSGPVSFVPGGAAIDVQPYPGAGGGSVTVRVPSTQLTTIVAGLSEVGDVTASSVSRQDVTDQTVDLRARIDAAQTSVTRLTQLMAQATSTTDLIAAESALADRQATLESYQQQLASLEGQVEMSTVSVMLQPRTTPVAADPAGFGDGLTAGWNGLVATLNGVVVAVGFLLPWIAVIALAALIVWVIVRAARRGRRARRAAEPD